MPSPNSHQCPRCGSLFSLKEDLIDHLKLGHKVVFAQPSEEESMTADDIVWEDPPLAHKRRGTDVTVLLGPLKEHPYRWGRIKERVAPLSVSKVQSLYPGFQFASRSTRYLYARYIGDEE